MSRYFRIGFPSYGRNSVFRDKPEIIIDKTGSIIGSTNPDKLENLNIPASAEDLALTDIKDKAFAGLKNLRTVRIEEGIEEIGREAFRDCVSLISASFPDSVYAIGEGVFENCQLLRSAELPSGIDSIPSCAFSKAISLPYMDIPETVREIGTMAFAYTKSLKSVRLPSGLTEISDGLFLGSGIERIRIPASVRRIGASAFSRAVNLNEIYYDGTLSEFRRISFGLHWNNQIPPSSALFLKDESGNFYNAFEGRKSHGESTEEEKALSLLGLRDGCSREEIERAFREKAKHFHPDMLSGKGLDPEFLEFAASRFRELQKAEKLLLSMK